MTNRMWILGAGDPEMVAIARLLADADESFGWATVEGASVHPGNAYKADGISQPELGGLEGVEEIILVECDLPGWFCGDPSPKVIRVDHHRPGDPGYGRDPKGFLPASSIGQVLQQLARLGLLPGEPVIWPETFGNNWADGSPDWAKKDPRQVGVFHRPNAQLGWWLVTRRDRVWKVPEKLALIAAADHCLEAAYRGLCTNVDPDALMKWRVETRAAFQKRPVAEVLADVEAAREILRKADARANDSTGMEGPYGIADLRGQHVPELPEASAREGIPFLSQVRDRDGREKVVLQSAPADLIQKFLAGEIIPGLKDKYGDPARGFAGGYLS